MLNLRARKTIESLQVKKSLNRPIKDLRKYF